jgi:uncharacterized DUF497 family protein
MAMDQSNNPFERISAFEWDENKRTSNLEKHGIDFEDAIEVFYGGSLLRRSHRNNEERWIAIGETEGRIVTVVFTRRRDTLRIISARRARKNEERDYRNQKMGRPPERQD